MNGLRFFVTSLLLTTLVFVSACVHAAGVRSAVPVSPVAPGTWAGEHLILEVSEKGASAEFDCAHGQITEPIAVDKHGNFSVTGTYTREHGGPVLRDESASSIAARYSGHVDGDTLNLTVTITKDDVQTFVLTRGSHMLLRKCR
jgi:hypothetical protein